MELAAVWGSDGQRDLLSQEDNLRTRPNLRPTSLRRAISASSPGIGYCLGPRTAVKDPISKKILISLDWETRRDAKTPGLLHPYMLTICKEKNTPCNTRMRAQCEPHCQPIPIARILYPRPSMP